MTQLLASTAALAALSLLVASSAGFMMRDASTQAASPRAAGAKDGAAKDRAAQDGAAKSAAAQAAGAAMPLGALQPIDTPVSADRAQPQMAVEGTRAVLSWIERTGTRATLKFSERTAAGWSAPRIVSSGDTFFVNWADVPSVRPLADGSLAAHWLQKSGSETYAYDVRLSFSRDGGKSWSAPVSPHRDGTKTEHGFASLFQAPGAGAGLGLIWLDGRAMTKEAAASHGGGHGAGAMSVRGAVFAPDGTQRSETLIDDRVCECCPTTSAITSEGPIVAFRNRDENEIRDIHVSRLVNGAWSASVPVHKDNWRIPACPVNGPALSASERRVAIAWFTMRDDVGHAFVAFSDDAGRTFGAPVRVDESTSLGRVDIELLPDGSAIVAWIEFAEQRAQLRLRRVARDGTISPSIAVAGLGANRTSGYPRLARVGDELLLAWTDTTAEKPRVRTARASLALTPAGNRVNVGKSATPGARR
jgi:hypothetical protein